VCGYFYSYNSDIDQSSLHYLKQRGPEAYAEYSSKNQKWGHSVLHTRGNNIVYQPKFSRYGVLTYNGSTYNSIGNDTDWIFDNLDDKLDTTVELIKSLVGEYSICYVTENHVVFAIDQWVTKNLWFYYSRTNRQLLVSSSRHVVDTACGSCVWARPNTIYVIDKNSFELTMLKTTDWDLRQNVDNYDKVFESFENAVRSRHEPGITTYTLSAGFDAGVINCCAQKLFGDRYTVARPGKEELSVLMDRVSIHNAVVEYEDDSVWEKRIKEILPETPFNHVYKNTARAWFSLICNHVLPQKNKIFIVGVGGDDLYSDYADSWDGRINRTRGLWPDDLRIVYPWHTTLQTDVIRQSSRLDVICGILGIEGRFPLLDQKLFQAWLNTTSELKNKAVKHWMREYLAEHDYPISEIKVGFTNWENIDKKHKLR